jgi:hypothetical protein
MNPNCRFFLSTLFLVLIGGIIAPNAYPQRRIPLANQPASEKITGHVEVEVIEVGHGMAAPATIKRPAGKFILLVVNRSHDPAASFVLEPASVGEGVIGPNPILRLMDQRASSKHRIAGLVDLPAGQFYLKSAATGKVLCRITID